MCCLFQFIVKSVGMHHPLPMTVILIFSAISTLTAQVPLKSDGVYRIGILGCHRQFEPAPSLLKYVEMQPDVCLWVGDNIYGDTQTEAGFLDSCYQALDAKPAFRLLQDNVPMLATWDDHDFGWNNAGRFYGLKEESKRLFRKFWDLEEEIPENQPGIYYSKTLEVGDKSLQVILLDVRFNRDDPGENADVLGKDQWEWLGETLKETADFRIIVSGFQLLLDADSGSETWAKFPAARERLFDLIRKSAVQRLVFVTGDQHYGEVSRMAKVLDFDAIELQFASINQIEDPEFNSHRVSPVCKSLHSYAMLDIQWDSTLHDIPHLLFRVFDASNDRLEVSYRVNFTEIETPVVINGPRTFTDSSLLEISHSFLPLQARFTVDDTEPIHTSPLYNRPISFRGSGLLKAALFDQEGFRRSEVESAILEKVTPIPGIPVKNLKEGLLYSYYEGDFHKIPDFTQLKAEKEGVALDFNLNELSNREDHYAMLFKGYLRVDTAGFYTFYTESDDGSKLFIHDQLVVDNDGSHSARRREGAIALSKGYHPLTVMYFEDYMGETLELFYKYANHTPQPLRFTQLYHQEN